VQPPSQHSQGGGGTDQAAGGGEGSQTVKDITSASQPTPTQSNSSSADNLRRNRGTDEQGRRERRDALWRSVEAEAALVTTAVGIFRLIIVGYNSVFIIYI
jgi:phage protein D